MKEARKRTSNSIVRIVFVGISVLIQIGWILLTILELNAYHTWISLATSLLSGVIVLKLYSHNETAAMKMPWVLLILIFPVMGLSLYLLVGILGDSAGTGKHLRRIRREMRPCLTQREQVLDGLQKKNPAAANQFRYLWRCSGSPAYTNTDVTYHAEAKFALEAIKQDLEQAESFIFMEYFIVEDGSAFQELQEILVRKAKEGIEVRLLYDDFGSVGYVNMKFARRLNAQGIQCRIFNPALPVVNLFMNHRDHRKITVIDGKVGFTGGFNLSDEYFGRKITFGRWKDTGIRLEGEAVRSLTAAFLEMWDACTRTREDVEPYLSVPHDVAGDCLAQPYEDDPLGRERVAENVYLHLIHSARKSLYAMTPYLIITDEMTNALGLAAKRGVDVRIITPGVPDKKLVYAVTRSYYAGLAAQGVRIFEYTPGFCHAKQMLCDGAVASIGTSNLDYRSLYLHFENDVLLQGGQAVADMARDFEELFTQCREVTEKYRSGRSRVLRLGQYILRLFAPLL